MPPSLRKAVAAAIGGGAIAIASVLITGPSGSDGLEGVSYIPYKDIVGVWTVCHGHMGAGQRHELQCRSAACQRRLPASGHADRPDRLHRRHDGSQ